MPKPLCFLHRHSPFLTLSLLEDVRPRRMSLDGVLISDVSRATKECNDSFLFLLTGPKGSGRTFTLVSFVKGMTSEAAHGREVSAVEDLLSAQQESADGAYSHCRSTGVARRVCWLSYSSLRHKQDEWMALMRDPSRRTPVFAPGSVLVVDDLEALWSLCCLNAELPVLKLLLRRLLASPGCALVASARSKGSVPTEVLEWRCPVTYSLPPLSQAAARRAVRAGFGASGENAFEGMEDCTAFVTPAASRGSLLLALCLTKEAKRELLTATEGEATQPRASTVADHLLWLETGGRSHSADEPSLHETTTPLYGLDEVRARLHLLISVFAASRKAAALVQGDRLPAAGSVAAVLRATTGILLHGPSGCGKSCLSRQLAAAFPGVAFFFVRCTSLFSKYLGESEERLRQVYSRARAQTPAVVILDDVDVIAPSRGSTADSAGENARRAGVSVNQRVLAGLLCELDGVTDNSGVLTIGTTNAPEILDSALLRQGRLETLILVPPLSGAAAVEIAQRFFAAFDGSAEAKAERAHLISRAAVGCSAAALQFVLRKLLEDSLVVASASDDTHRGARVVDTAQLLPLPSCADIGGILLATSPMMPRLSYSFDTQGCMASRAN